MPPRKKTSGVGAATPEEVKASQEAHEDLAVQASPATEEEKAPPVQGPETPDQVATRMAKAGVPEGIIIATLNTMFGGGDGQGQAAPRPTPGTPGGGEQLGPDPEMVAAYQARINAPDYKKAVTRKRFCALRSEDQDLQALLFKALSEVEDDATLEEVVEWLCDALDGFGGVLLPLQFNEWCVQWQYWQQSIRRMRDPSKFSESKVLEDMIRFHWFNHPYERTQLRAAQNPNQTSGLKDAFSPAAGNWSKTT